MTIKKIFTSALLLTGILITTFPGYSQVNKQVPKLSRADSFGIRTGILLKKELKDVGELKKCHFKILHQTDLMSGRKIAGLKIESTFGSGYTFRTKAAILDEDEIDGLLTSIKLIQSKIFTTNPTDYTEVKFISRDGFEIGCFTKKGSWQGYLQLDEFDNESFVTLDKDDYDQIIPILEKAKTLL